MMTSTFTQVTFHHKYFSIYSSLTFWYCLQICFQHLVFYKKKNFANVRSHIKTDILKGSFNVFEQSELFIHAWIVWTLSAHPQWCVLFLTIFYLYFLHGQFRTLVQTRGAGLLFRTLPSWSDFCLSDDCLFSRCLLKACPQSPILLFKTLPRPTTATTRTRPSTRTRFTPEGVPRRVTSTCTCRV